MFAESAIRPVLNKADRGSIRPFWSVMIPAYNPTPQYLRETLEGVLWQDPGKSVMQIEVVDDCSQEVDVTNVVKEIAGSRVIVSRTAQNLGLAGCWNTCIQRSLGEWVHILHQDDIISNGFYVGMKGLILANPDAGAAFCRAGYVDGEGNRFFEDSPLQSNSGPIPDAVETMAARNRVQCPAIVVRREAYERLGGYDASLLFTLDWEMWIRIASVFMILYQNENLASFRIQAKSETSRLARTGETVRDSMKMISNYEAYIPSQKLAAVKAEASEWICDLAMQKARNFARQGDEVSAMSQLRAALRYDRRISYWLASWRCWIDCMKSSRRMIFPPLPCLTEPWIKGRDI